MDVVLELSYNTHTLVERTKIKFLFMKEKGKKKKKKNQRHRQRLKSKHKNNYTFGETKNIKWFNGLMVKWF